MCHQVTGSFPGRLNIKWIAEVLQDLEDFASQNRYSKLSESLKLVRVRIQLDADEGTVDAVLNKEKRQT